MLLRPGNRLIFILFLNLFLVCSPCISAQGKNWTPDPGAELPPKTSQIKIPDNDGIDLKKAKTGKKENLTDLQNILQAEVSLENVAEPKIEAEKDTRNVQQFDNFGKTQFNDLTTTLQFIDKRERHLIFDDAATVVDRKFFLPARSSIANLSDDATDTAPIVDESFRWRSAIGQSLMFLGVQHGYAFTQLKTRQALKGKFFKDYVKSVKSLHGWADGGRFFTNYVAHPMQGSFLGFIQVQNDPKGLKQQFGKSGDYWRSRMKAMAWSAAWSTQFEIGPISQASIGNVGLKGKQTYIDIVITPTVGTTWLIGEDALDRFVMKRIERGTGNFYAIIFSRMLLSPTRTMANLLRFKPPWHRDRPREH